MKFLHPSFIETLRALLQSEVDFLLIGGYAVNYHEYGRPTGDMDIWLRPANENKKKLLNAFNLLKYQNESIENISHLDFTDAQVFFIGKEPLRIDFLTKINLQAFC